MQKNAHLGQELEEETQNEMLESLHLAQKAFPEPEEALPVSPQKEGSTVPQNTKPPGIRIELLI
jgi:hypothetical protein